jgi:PAS domain S-box-containing protein
MDPHHHPRMDERRPAGKFGSPPFSPGSGAGGGLGIAEEGLYRLLVDSVQDYAIFLLDLEGRVASWNPGAHRIKQYEPAEIIGRHFSAFYPEEDIAAGKPEWELRVVREEGRYEEEAWRVRKDGTRFWANVVITAVRDSDGVLRGYAKVTRDLTERREAQMRAIADAARVAKAETANRAKMDFLAAMSHELRTPLNAIGGYTELLAMGLRGPVTASQLEDLERIRRSQQHLLGIINDLLNFSRLESGRLSYRIETVPLAAVIGGVSQMMEPQAVAKGIAFEHGGCPREARALADAGKVEQILLNLLSNAVKFTGGGGQIKLSCAVVADVVEIRVADTGPGIAEDDRESVFEPFVQLGRSLTSSHEGTGLGLAISRDLARAMAGDLRVDSVAGEGSTFILSLPAT